ncbi:hypothetical protein JK358_35905 [Nocardia sp. 2]|uniref:Uncharacterized protein n=1 Tax=Nocardia acididurans TaxID=2802282 RepID=A0ABS1MGK9_9NOCA|nr:hypothetical protein [Nocardia acididurans]MBL1079801.1 hypothetical protein [Nocardia acididurans]
MTLTVPVVAAWDVDVARRIVDDMQSAATEFEHTIVDVSRLSSGLGEYFDTESGKESEVILGRRQDQLRTLANCIRSLVPILVERFNEIHVRVVYIRAYLDVARELRLRVAENGRVEHMEGFEKYTVLRFGPEGGEFRSKLVSEIDEFRSRATVAIQDLLSQVEQLDNTTADSVVDEWFKVVVAASRF